MANLTVYVVRGSTGEYSDRSEWPVRAFMSETEAQALVLAATDRARAIEYERRDRCDLVGVDSRLTNEYDSNMSMDYNGTFYNYETVELVGNDEEIAVVVAEQKAGIARRRRGITLLEKKEEI